MTRRPRLALPFTVLAAPDTVRLVAGEDHRYTLNAPGLDTWLPGFLASMDGARALDDLIAALDAARRDEARDLAGQLYGERVLVEGIAAPPPGTYRIVSEGPLLRDLDGAGDRVLRVLAQDRLDYEAAQRFGRDCRDPWIWASAGPLTRAYVGPVFLPGASPCFECLLRQFRRLSPAPEIYDDLAELSRRGGEIRPSPVPEPGLQVLRAIVRWKASALADPSPPAALFRLHVVEMDSIEVSTHRVLPDPECPGCA